MVLESWRAGRPDGWRSGWRESGREGRWSPGQNSNGRQPLPPGLITRRRPPLILIPRLLFLLVRLSPLTAAALVALTLIGGVLPAYELSLTRQLLDRAAAWLGQGREGFQAVIPWGILLVATMTVSAVVELVSTVLETSLRERVSIHLQRSVIEKALSVDLAYFEHPAFFDTLQRANQDMGGRLVNLLRLLFDVAGAVVTLASLLVVLLQAHWALAPLTVLGTAPGFWVVMRMNRRTYWVYRVRTPENRRAMYLRDLLTRRDEVKEVRLFTLGQHLMNLWQELSVRLAVERRTLEVKQAGLQALSQTVSASAYGGCLLILLHLTGGGRLTFGHYAMLVQALQQFSTRIEQILRAAGGLQEQSLYLGDLYEFLEMELVTGEAGPGRLGPVAPAGTATPAALAPSAPARPTSGQPAVHPASAPSPTAPAAPAPAAAQAPAAPALAATIAAPRPAAPTLLVPGEHRGGRLDLIDVTFAYPGSERPVLQGVTLTIEAGERLALVGENGAGKSTLVKLMMGLYRPTSGRILLDGQDVAALPPEQVRERFAAVFQDFVRYWFPIRTNIAFGRLGRATEEEIRHAAELAGAAPFIEALPDGYDTLLGRPLGGLDLSGGQWQKLALARALVRNADVVVLDEPTAALDPKAEAEVYRQFSEITRDRTTILISHRLGSARLADRIAVLKGGRLVEVGTHDELVASDGEYARLFQLQAQWYL